MKPEFTSALERGPGLIADLLERSYRELVSSAPRTWEKERASWREYDEEIFAHPASVGAYIFLTWVEGRLAGFGSYDPRRRPELGIVGHHCILPEFRGRGIGKEQFLEILRRLGSLGIRSARVSTSSHPFFIPAQKLYVSSGFAEISRKPWDSDPSQEIITYEKRLTDPPVPPSTTNSD